MLINRSNLYDLFGKREGNSILITLAKQGITHKTKAEYISSSRNGKAIKVYNQTMNYDLDECIDYYENSTDLRYTKLYSRRAEKLREYQDDNRD